MHTRRQFVEQAPLGLLAVIAACRGGVSEGPSPTPAPAAGPGAPPQRPAPRPRSAPRPVSAPRSRAATFAEAEKLVQVTMTPAERSRPPASWRRSMAPLIERRTGPRKVALPETVAPATLWNPLLRGARGRPHARSVRARHAATRARSRATTTRSPSRPSRSSRAGSSRASSPPSGSRSIYLDRIERLDGQAPRGHHAHPRSRARAGAARPTPRSPPASIAVRCTASRTA